MQEAKDKGVANKVIVMIGSDFGRTPSYNRVNGKDHWPTSSMMIMGAGIRGNRVIGKSTTRHVPMKVNPNTLEIDEDNGIPLTPAHIHKSLRKYLGISNHKYVSETFHLATTEDMPIII